MSAQIPFIVVEDRKTEALACCVRAAELAGETLIVLAETDGGAAYRDFVSAYVHHSSNPKDFEVVCFRRYFLLQQYLLATPACQHFVLIDSDVLLFKGVGRHFMRIAGRCAFAGSTIVPSGWDPCQISPHTSYWRSASLHDFVNYVLRIYSSTSGRRALAQIADQFRQRGRRGGVSDMTLLNLWAKATNNLTASNKISRFGVVDHNINLPHNHQEWEFMMRGGAKRLTYIQGEPHLTTAQGKRVKALTLHFQGTAKLVMRDALQGNQLQLTSTTFAILVARTVKECLFKIRATFKRLRPAVTDPRS